jgi:dienelactone hydrolase
MAERLSLQQRSCAHKWRAPIFAALLLTLGLSMPTQAFAESLEQRIERLEPHWRLTRPDREGRVPVVIMLHGCGGPRPFIDDMAEVVTGAGAAAIQIDSFAPRRISRVAAFATVCTGATLRGGERAGDLYAAIAWARRQSWVDPERIIAIGWSHGSWTIMDALSLRTGAEMERYTGLTGLGDEPLDGLAATLLVYPYTGIGSFVGKREWRIAPASAAIVAQHDFIVGESRRALTRQRERGAPIEIHVFEGATHAFEDAHAEDPRVRYNPAATAREHDMLRDMIGAL